MEDLLELPTITFVSSSFFIYELLCLKENLAVTSFYSILHTVIALLEEVSSYNKMVLVRAEPTSWADLEALEGFQVFKEKLVAHG